MAYELKYVQNYAGAKLTALKDGAQVRDGLFDYGTVYSVKKGDYVILSGYAYYDGQYSLYFQTTTGLFVYINTYDGTENSWNITEGAVTLPNHSQSQAQALVDKIIKNNITIVQNNLVCARYANKFTKEQQQQIRDLQKRAEARKSALIKQGLCSDVKTSYPKGYADLGGYLDKLMQGDAVGVVTWATVVLVAMVIAATATAAYFAYKFYADESEQDVKFSKELTAILAQKLTPEEYQQLLDETQGIVTKARIKSALGSYGNILMIVAAAVGGVALFRLIKNKL